MTLRKLTAAVLILSQLSACTVDQPFTRTSPYVERMECKASKPVLTEAARDVLTNEDFHIEAAGPASKHLRTGWRHIQNPEKPPQNKSNHFNTYNSIFGALEIIGIVFSAFGALIDEPQSTRMTLDIDPSSDTITMLYAYPERQKHPSALSLVMSSISLRGSSSVILDLDTASPHRQYYRDLLEVIRETAEERDNELRNGGPIVTRFGTVRLAGYKPMRQLELKPDPPRAARDTTVRGTQRGAIHDTGATVSRTKP